MMLFLRHENTGLFFKRLVYKAPIKVHLIKENVSFWMSIFWPVTEYGLNSNNFAQIHIKLSYVYKKKL